MLNIKKMIALTMVAFATLVCLVSFRIKQSELLCKTECIKTASCLPKADNFSIVNILSLQFR